LLKWEVSIALYISQIGTNCTSVMMVGGSVLFIL